MEILEYGPHVYIITEKQPVLEELDGSELLFSSDYPGLVLMTAHLGDELQNHVKNPDDYPDEPYGYDLVTLCVLHHETDTIQKDPNRWDFSKEHGDRENHLLVDFEKLRLLERFI